MLVAVDVGGTKIAVASAQNPAELADVQRVATPPTGDGGVAEICRLVRSCAGDSVIDAIGLSCAGPLDVARGMLIGPRKDHWVDLPVVERLEDELGIPVVMENDANCGAVAEHRVGAGQGSSAMLYVTISTGIGTGLVLDGSLYRGAHDTEGGCITVDPDGPTCPACGGRGHFEALASGTALRRDFGATPDKIADPEVWDAVARRLAIGLSSLMAMLSPDRVVLGGGVSNQFHRFGDSLERHLEALRPPYGPAPVVPARYVDDAPLYGALFLAEERVGRPSASR